MRTLVKLYAFIFWMLSVCTAVIYTTTTICLFFFFCSPTFCYVSMDFGRLFFLFGRGQFTVIVRDSRLTFLCLILDSFRKYCNIVELCVRVFDRR